VSNYRKGQKVKAVKSIQRSTGAAWHDDEGEIVAVTGDGYRARFKDRFVANTVKDNDVKKA